MKKKNDSNMPKDDSGRTIISSRKEDENGCRKGILLGGRIPNANLIMVIIKCGFLWTGDGLFVPRTLVLLLLAWKKGKMKGSDVIVDASNFVQVV